MLFLEVIRGSIEAVRDPSVAWRSGAIAPSRSPVVAALFPWKEAMAEIHPSREVGRGAQTNFQGPNAGQPGESAARPANAETWCVDGWMRGLDWPPELEKYEVE